MMEDKNVDFQKIHTKKNPVDALTKLVNNYKYI